MWIPIFPNIGVSSKPNENRMGKGKGKVRYFCGRVVAGNIICEVTGVNYRLAWRIFYLVGKKLPVKTCFVYKY